MHGFVRKIKAFQIIKIFGGLLTILSVGYVISMLVKVKIDVWLQITNISGLLYLILFVIVYMILAYLTIFSNKIILQFLEEKPVRFINIVSVNIRSNMAKYIPGNFLQFVSRNFLGSLYGYKQSNIALSSIIEIALNIFCTILIILLSFTSGLIVIPESLMNSIGIYSIKARFGILILLIVSAIALIIYFLLKTNNGINIFFVKLFKKAKLFFSIYFFAAAIKVTLIYMFVFIILGLFFVFIFSFFLNNPVSMHQSFFIVTAYIFSWLMGYITPGSPAGIGVREAVLVLLLGPAFGREAVISAAIIHRTITILGDILTFSIGMYTYRLSKS